MACASETMPLDYVYMIDVPHSVCSKKEVIDRDNLLFRHSEDLPLIECDGNVSISMDEWLDLKNWIQKQKAKVR